ncbi:MAG: NAD-dependent DNA ligase LigA [Lachnospiraceae bacterium]|nr:NAD-dependent DNA ligase LigA [Lachnospiraceae bacterium]
MEQQAVERMKELVERLNEAARVYYQGQDEIMSNYEYDKLYDELEQLEKDTGIVMSASPTSHVGYETISELPKEAHIAPMLSLDKTKEVEELTAFLGEQEGLLSLKLDGLSVILTYEGGRLAKALTRGNGEIGEVITNNARTFVNIPGQISYAGTLVIRGEALIRYSDFERLNTQTAEISEKYKNPRNLCSGSVRQLNNEITAKRHVHFYVYNIISAGEDARFATKKEELDWLSGFGFDVVPYKKVKGVNLPAAVEQFSKEVTTCDLPSDGLVLTFDDIAYSASLGRTAKFPRDSLAFKWQDELADTTLQEIEWSASRTGLINPVAIFEPVELEGTTVSRASVHNISILKELKLGIGDTISVYKANMIIPQIYENKIRSGNCKIPDRCPVCEEETELVNENGSIVLMCKNPDCYAKKIKSLSHFVSRDAMNIDGLSEATLEKLINMKLIHSVSDIFHLAQYKDVFVEMEGFGEKSFQNLMEAIERAKDVPLEKMIYSLGIKGIGLSMARLIVRTYPFTPSEMNQLTVEQLCEIDGIGEVLARSFVDFFANEKNQELVEQLEHILRIQYPESVSEQPLEGKTFVITGSLSHFDNRSQCKERIEALGGKVAGSVSSRTDYLVNNDIHSSSSKNKKAKELNIPILTEEELLVLLSGEPVRG